ncbi:MAG TPA: hydroxymethylglutaryl-CoA lyase [Thermomicrobiaceae bacterium]|nr:hydroxymethylglutaryl-CoA lyase [Thermomicrobiaceae bacterium]
MHLPERVLVTEVGPRDGLQNEATSLTTARKAELIARLAAAGLSDIEATSFVHPRWIPQLADAEDLMPLLPRRGGIAYTVLIPNLRGYERAAPLRPDAVTLVCSASERHNRANLNRSTEESLAGLAEVAARARADGVPVRGAISTAFWCPFEGRVPVERVVWVARAYAEMGAVEVSLADTLGTADPRHVATLVPLVREAIGLPVSLHLHDTAGMALACVVAGLEVGIDHFDAAIGGLGGCPYAPGAAGNLATEDLVFMLHRLGIATGVDEERLLDAARFAREAVGHDLHSRRLALADAGALPPGA